MTTKVASRKSIAASQAAPPVCPLSASRFVSFWDLERFLACLDLYAPYNNAYGRCMVGPCDPAIYLSDIVYYDILYHSFENATLS
jgi:hypothetical protein